MGAVPTIPSRAGLLAGLRHLLDRRLGPGGEAAAPHRRAAPGDAALDSTQDATRDATQDAAGETGRRDRRLGLPQEILDRSLSGKVLDGWLQNRHQVLVPLTLRLGRLSPDDAALVMRFTAVAVLNATDGGDGARRSAERWLREIGAPGDGLGPFAAALDSPPPLSQMLAALRARDLAPYAYAAAVAAVDTREPAGRVFASFVAIRLDLPADAVRSIDRRARR